MTIKRLYNRVVRRQLGFRGAWPLVTNKYEVGTFGLMRAGVFVDIGHIKNFGVNFDVVTTPPSSYHYKSEGATKVRTQAGVNVPVFEALDVDAQLDVAFEGTRSVNIDIQKLYSQEMTSPYEVARALSKHPEWKMRYRIIDKVYIAEYPAIFLSESKGTTVSIKGKAKFLKLIDEGLVDINADVNVEVKSENTWAMPSKDHPSGVGPVHMHLFRVRGGSASPIKGELSPEEDIIDGSEDWPLDDDDSDMNELPPEQD